MLSHTHTHLRTYICLHTHTHTRFNTRTNLHMFSQAHTHTCTHKQKCFHTRTHLDMLSHTHAHTHTFSRTNIYTSKHREELGCGPMINDVYDTRVLRHLSLEFSVKPVSSVRARTDRQLWPLNSPLDWLNNNEVNNSVHPNTDQSAPWRILWLWNP